MNNKFICPTCQSDLEQKNNVYHCNKCTNEYPFYIIDGLTIIDFNSLNMTKCECNRDGITTCKIDLMHQLPTNLPENKTQVEGEGRMEQLIEREIGTGNRVLDIGCAEGTYAHLFTHNNECYGYDQCAKRMLLNERNSIDKGYKTLLLNNGISTPFPDDFFDVILCTEIIEHVLETRQFITEMNRILKNNGKLILSTPNLANFGNRIGMLFGKGLKFEPVTLLKGKPYPLQPWREGGIEENECSFESIRYPEQPLHIRFFTFESLRKFLKQTGFTVETEIGVGMTHTRLDPFLSRMFKKWTDDILVVARKLK